MFSCLMKTKLLFHTLTIKLRYILMVCSILLVFAVFFKAYWHFALGQYRVRFHEDGRVVVTCTDVTGWQPLSLSLAFWHSSWYFHGWVVFLLLMIQVLIPFKILIFELLSKKSKGIWMSLIVCVVLFVEGWEIFVWDGVPYSQEYQFITH